MQKVFESENIAFVRVSERLVPDYLNMVNDVERVARWIGTRTEPIPEEKEIGWVRKKLANGDLIWSMIEKRTGAFIGNIELMGVQDSVGELGIAITAAQQEKGFGKEAIAATIRYGLESVGLNRIFLKVFPDNARAIHVYRACGFKEYDRTDTDVFMEIVRDDVRPFRTEKPE